MARIFLLLAAISAGLAVGLGAFGAHVLEERLEADLLEIFNTATYYHLTHALGLAIVAIIARQLPHSKLIRWSGWLIFIGFVIFSGTLYGITFTDIRKLGAITPIGGICMIMGWVLLAIAGWKHWKEEK